MNRNTDPHKRANGRAHAWVDDHRVIRWAILGALVLHMLFFFVGLPGWSQPTSKADVVRITRPDNVVFNPPENEPTTQPTTSPFLDELAYIPVPDLTPQDPEPFRPPEPEPASVQVPSFEFGPTTWAPPAPPGEPLRIDATIERPVLIYKVSPRYPPMAVTAGVQGVVLLEAVILADGTVGDIRVLKSLGKTGCDEAAIEALKQYRFKPATQNGVPVSVYMTLEVNFTLR